MVELTRQADGRFSLAFGGDTFNTAVYLARCGLAVSYATALGDDPYSQGIVDLARSEGIATDLIARVGGRNAGLYLIEIGARGERTFWYWRERAPAREIFETAAADAISRHCARAGLVYVSGITLSIYTPAGLDGLAACLSAARASGAVIVMDGNYRPRNFGGDTARARAVFERFWRLADIALPTFDDEQALWGDATPQQSAARLSALGVREVAVKLGADGVLLAGSGPERIVACPAIVTPVDTTAAGDSFNAGYLATRQRGGDTMAAALAGHRLARIVIQHRGAIVPREATAGVV